PPYLVRVLVGSSSAAAYIGAAMAREPYFLVDQPLSTRLEHLESIVRTARDVLAARHIPFLVVVLPSRTWIDERETWQHYAPQILEVMQRLGVRAIDPSDVLRDAAVRGQQVFFEHGDIHFNAHGHALLAMWLHEQLPDTSSPSGG